MSKLDSSDEAKYAVDLIVVVAGGGHEEEVFPDRDAAVEYVREYGRRLGIAATIVVPGGMCVVAGEQGASLEFGFNDGVLSVTIGGRLIRAYSPSGWTSFHRGPNG